MSDLSARTTAIEGIGPAVAAELRKLGIYLVADLLRVDPGRLRDALGGRRSLERVRGWCSMARLLQISVMTPQWAEALVRAGVFSPAEMRARELGDLRQIFTDAKEEGVIPLVPDDAAVASMMREAAILEFTGALNGTLQDEHGDPVAGADVRVGREHEVSDERGRFRIIRIPLAAKATLAVSRSDFQPARFRLRRVEASSYVGGKTFKLRPLRDGRAAPKRVLREVHGDVLPPVGNARIGSREVQREDLVNRDIFALTEFSADRKRVKLVSKLLAYEDGVFWLPFVWVAVSELKRGAESGDCLVLRGDKFAPIRMTAEKLQGWPGLMRMRKRMGPRPETVDEAEAWLAKGAEILGELGRRRERH